jgi:hypothetical protein
MDYDKPSQANDEPVEANPMISLQANDKPSQGSGEPVELNDKPSQANGEPVEANPMTSLQANDKHVATNEYNDKPLESNHLGTFFRKWQAKK